MTMVTPKTIVITSLPARSTMITRPVMTSHMMASAAALPLAVTEGLGINGEPKKRKRLSNLTPDERLMRRKLKNRVAAQTARDRKKQRMDELEVLLAEIEAENKQLQSENDALRAKTGKLAVENRTLKQKLGSVVVGGDDEVSMPESPESAVLFIPPQQEPTRATKPSTPRHTSMLQMLLTFSLTCCLASLKKSPVTAVTAVAAGSKRRPLQRRLQRRRWTHRPPPLLTWWGPQQQSWTPSMN
jgi:X box-binding protein 1